MDAFIQKGNMHQHESGQFRLRVRKGRCIEAEFSGHEGIWISTGTRDFREAERFALSKLASHGRLVKERGRKLSEFGDVFFGTIEDSILRKKNERFGKKFSDSHYAHVISLYNNYIRPFFGDSDPSSLTDVIIEDWYTSLISIRDDKPLGSTTKLMVLDAFNQLMKELKRQDIIDRNPCDTVERLRVSDKQPREAFTYDEVQKLFPESRKELLSIWRNLRWAVYFSIMSDTGWRPGEVMGISKSSLYLNGVFQMSSVDSRTKSAKNSIKTTNSGQKYKIGLLSEYTRSLLDDYIPTLKRDYLFQDFDGTFPTQMANRVLREAMKNAGVPIASPVTGKERTQYGFRHFFSTYIHDHRGMNGLMEEDISEMMAHTNYRPEYDHRSAQMMIFRLQSKASDAINDIHRKAE